MAEYQNQPMLLGYKPWGEPDEHAGGVDPQRAIRRDSAKHAWVLVGDTAQGNPLPWSDEARAISLLWLNTQMHGHAEITGEL